MIPGSDELMVLLRLVTEPEAVQARLQQLQAATDAAARREAAAAAAHAELGGERERLAKIEASLRDREVAVFASERRHERELFELQKWKREHAPRSRLIHHSNGLTQEPDDTPVTPDPITDPFAPSMTEELANRGPITVGPAHRSMRRAEA